MVLRCGAAPPSSICTWSYARVGRSCWVGLFFEATKWSGEIRNGEPTKCEGWAWFDLDALPDPVVPYMAEALEHIRRGVPYSERNWPEGS